MNRHRFARILKDFWHAQFVCRIQPRQKWLSDKIGRVFVDKDFIIETTLFESVIHFWEMDRGEEVTRYQFEAIEAPCRSEARNPEDQEEYLERRQVYSELLECYSYAKVREQIWEEYWRSRPTDKWKQRQLIIDRETEFLQTIVRLRKYIWT